ncbi:unnamed protein product [Moneuplotes crassus]|uniref:Uncharacterized protein n=1 Tax=Euplotes crassus TaxID=5936 RepID=A0AAD1XZ67_EUPCR|nr:unnamed protein product [Moneuplotes crassus]
MEQKKPEQRNEETEKIIPSKLSDIEELEEKSLLARKVASVPILLLFGTYNLFQVNKYWKTYPNIWWIKYLYVLPASFFVIGTYQMKNSLNILQEVKNKKLELEKQKEIDLKNKILGKGLATNEDQAEELANKIIDSKKNPSQRGRMF